MATTIQYYTVVCVVILALAVHCNIEHVLPHMARRANRRCVQQNLVHCPICHIEHSSKQYMIGRKEKVSSRSNRNENISNFRRWLTSKLKARYSFLMLGRQWSQRRPRKQAWGWGLSYMWSKSWEELDPACKPASRRHFEPEKRTTKFAHSVHASVSVSTLCFRVFIWSHRKMHLLTLSVFQSCPSKLLALFTADHRKGNNDK